MVGHRLSQVHTPPGDRPALGRSRRPTTTTSIRRRRQQGPPDDEGPLLDPVFCQPGPGRRHRVPAGVPRRPEPRRQVPARGPRGVPADAGQAAVHGEALTACTCYACGHLCGLIQMGERRLIVRPNILCPGALGVLFCFTYICIALCIHVRSTIGSLYHRIGRRPR